MLATTAALPTGVRGRTPDVSPKPAYTFILINDSDVANLGDTLTGLGAGAHTLTVFDANMCASHGKYSSTNQSAAHHQG